MFCFVAIWIFGGVKLFSLGMCESAIPRHAFFQGRTVGKVKSTNLVSIAKGEVKMLVQEDWQRGFTRNSSRPPPQKETLSKWKRNLRPPLMSPHSFAHFPQLFNKGPDGLHVGEPFRHGASRIASNFLGELYSQQNPGGHNNPWLSVHGNKVPFCKMWQRLCFLGLYTNPVFTLIGLCLSSVCSSVVSISFWPPSSWVFLLHLANTKRTGTISGQRWV